MRILTITDTATGDTDVDKLGIRDEMLVEHNRITIRGPARQTTVFDITRTDAVEVSAG